MYIWRVLSRTLIATTKENHLLAFDLQSIAAVHEIVTLHQITEEIRVWAFGLKPILGEYVLKT
jgi:hypothetical protein